MKLHAIRLLQLIALTAMTYLYKTYNIADAPTSTFPTQVPLIVIWTEYFKLDLSSELIPMMERCHHRCEIIDRRKQKFDNRVASAYIMHGPNINYFDLPAQSRQYLNVLLVRESPATMEDKYRHFYRSDYKHDNIKAQHKDGKWPLVPQEYFNATMTYKSNSHYVYAYGRFEKKSSEDTPESVITQKELILALKRKTKGSLVFISNCNTLSRREDKIRTLSKFTEITVRGKCEKRLAVNSSLGSALCKVDCKDDDLIATHRFYLAFENTVCDEYITEKFYARISQLLVPVVLTRQIYERAGIPPESFIAVDDFDSFKKLGKHLNYLRKNDTAYLEYFEWTQDFRKPTSYRSDALCKLCEDIYNKESLVLNTSHEYFDTRQCY